MPAFRRKRHVLCHRCWRGSEIKPLAREVRAYVVSYHYRCPYCGELIEQQFPRNTAPYNQSQQ
jgi:hypothetical protein